MDKRLNIGFLIDDLDNYFSYRACKGAELAAKAMNANLFIFPGHYLGATDSKYEDMEYEYQYNTVFSLTSIRSVDILYVLMGTIGSRADFSVQKEFLDKLPNVPIVTLFASIEGYPSVTFDNKSGFGRAIRHVIEDHGIREIGFVSGPKTNKDAIERLQAFREVMTEEGLEVDENHIVYGDFTENSCDIVRELFVQYPEMKAIVFANDNMALGGYRVIRERGLVPGSDIAVVGFDDDIFSVSMDPPLTTVEASSADLTYKAVMNAHNFIESTELSSMEVETYLVQRNSCGCDGLDLDDMASRLFMDNMKNGDREFIEAIKKYLFGIFEDDEAMLRIKDALDMFCMKIVEFVYDKNIKRNEVDKSFDEIIKTNLLSYTSPERFFNVLQAMQFIFSNDLVNESETLILINDMFSGYYRSLSFAGVSMTSENSNRMERVSRLVTKQTGDIFLMSNENDIPYDHLVDGLYTVGFKKSFLYLFQGNIKNQAGKNWKCPNTMLLKALSDETGATSLAEEQQLLRTSQMFLNEHVDQTNRLTMTVSPLFVGEDLYGMLVNDLDSTYFGSVSPVAYQLSVTLKSLIMIEEQNKVKQNLQDSLEKFMRDNSLLDEISKSDELTGLYNRRGFLDYAQKAITDNKNIGKKALICYADMDNLKMVNDMFGHDNGDFALREIAAILKDTFRSTDILGRFGGDEFVAFAIIGHDDYETAIKSRIASITLRHNEKAGKPYPIEMSVGIQEFICGPEVDIYQVLDQADEKLYEEKKKKKAVNGSYR